MRTVHNLKLQSLFICGLLLLFSCGRVHPPVVEGVSYEAPVEPQSLDAQVTVVDDGSGGADAVGFYASLDYDSGNTPHIAYYDFSNGDLKYAVRSGGTFNVTVVDSSGDVGSYCSLAIDRNDHPHIAYYDDTNQRVKYARWDASAGQWEIRVLDGPEIAVGHPGLWISLDVGVNDPPVVNISYINEQNYDLRYLRWAGFGDPEIWLWVDQGVGAGFSPVGGVINNKTSIALDYGDIPHILYYDASNADLKLARHDPVGAGYPRWDLEQVKKMRTRELLGAFTYDSASDTYRATLDFPSTQDESETVVKQFTGTFQPVGDLRRSEYNYVDDRTIEIYSAVYRSNYQFSIDYPRADVNIDENDFLFTTYFQEDWDEGYWNDLVIEPRANGSLNICYYNADLGDLSYGRWAYTGDDVGAWTLETVDRGGFVGAYCSIALRQPADDYLPVIAYYDVVDHQLRFAAREEGEWQPYIVNTEISPGAGVGTQAGAWASLGVAGDTVGVAFQDVEGDALLYAELDYPP